MRPGRWYDELHLGCFPRWKYWLTSAEEGKIEQTSFGLGFRGIFRRCTLRNTHTHTHTRLYWFKHVSHQYTGVFRGGWAYSLKKKLKTTTSTYALGHMFSKTTMLTWSLAASRITARVEEYRRQGKGSFPNPNRWHWFCMITHWVHQTLARGAPVEIFITRSMAYIHWPMYK